MRARLIKIIGPDGRRFLTFVELARQRDQLEIERNQLAQELSALEQRAAEARRTAERLAAQLRARGIEPER
jgi:hypothetical protein